MGDIAIRVENLSKYYKLGVINSGTLSRDLQSWLWKKMGKEDPNKRIGEGERNLDGFWALKDLNFEIKKGERIGIIGKNGAGKSTLLKMLSQISAPTEGKIYIDGKIASLLEVGTGFNPELTGRENIYLNGAILGMKKKEVDRKLDEIIAFSEIERHIDTPVKRYSSGMYVRLAFAVAAHLESDILIADEVLAVGDAAFQKKALGKMNELSTGQGRTVLFVSHNMGQVRRLCNKGIVLEKGQVMRVDEDVSDSIDWYMGGGASLGIQNIWHNDNQYRHYNCTFDTISLVDSNGDLKASVSRSLDDKLFVKLVFYSQEVSSIMNIGLTIINRQNEVVLSTWLCDTDKTTIRQGKNILYVKLPTNNLNLGDYRIFLAAGLHHTAYIIPPEMNSPILAFSVTGTLGIAMGDDVRGGAFVPIIEWKDSLD